MTQPKTKMVSTLAPVAPRRPHSFTTHGITVVDDYAWLKDANWQEVLRDPSILDPDIRNYLEAENDYTESLLGHTARLAEEAGRGNARADQGRRFQRAVAGRAVMPICANSARAASTNCSAACRATAARPRSFSTATRSRPTRILQVRRRAAFAGPPASGLERRHQGLGIFFDSRARLGRLAPIATISSRKPTAAWCGARIAKASSTSSSTTIIARCRSGGIGWARRRRTISWSMRNRIPAGSPICMKAPAAGSA